MNQRQHAPALATGIDVGLRAHMTGTYNLIAGGLAVSAVTAWLVANTSLHGVFFGPEGKPTALGLVGMFSPLALLLLASFGAIGKSLGSARTIYWFFAALQGIGLSLLAVRYSAGSVTQAMALAAATFAATSLYGYTTRRNLTGMGSFMIIGLFGIIIASIVNLFMQSAAVDFALSVIGILVFAGLTAYDTQNLKESYDPSQPEEQQAAVRYWGALGLYLNVLNLVQFFLNLGRN